MLAISLRVILYDSSTYVLLEPELYNAWISCTVKVSSCLVVIRGMVDIN